MQNEKIELAGERTHDEFPMIQCGMETHLNLTGEPKLAGKSYFSKQNDRIVSVYECDGFYGKWSASRFAMPQIDRRVRINFNGLGEGVVTGFFIESGWLGMYVKLDKEPAWRAANPNQRGKDCMVFGAEIEL